MINVLCCTLSHALEQWHCLCGIGSRMRDWWLENVSIVHHLWLTRTQFVYRIGKNAGLEWNKVCQKHGFSSDPSIPNDVSLIGLLVKYPHGIIWIVSFRLVQLELNEPVSWSKFVVVKVLFLTDFNTTCAIKFYCFSFCWDKVNSVLCNEWKPELTRTSDGRRTDAHGWASTH